MSFIKKIIKCEKKRKECKEAKGSYECSYYVLPSDTTNKKCVYKIILDGQKSLNKQSNLKGSNNELISGQTFYKFFRKNSGKTDRKHKTSILGLNKGYNISSSTFDTKNMNSILIMSKTMGGTKEGFFRHNNKNISRINPSSIKEEIIIKKEEQKEPYNNSNTNNTILKSGYKPKIMVVGKKKE